MPNGTRRRVFKRRPLSSYKRFLREKIGLSQMPPGAALENLVDIAAVFERRNCRYSLTAGTLLGAVRHGDFITYDKDTDILVAADEFNPLVIRDLYDKGFHISRCFGYPDDGMELRFVRYGVDTDLFLLYPRGDETYFSAYSESGDGSAAVWIDYMFPVFEYGWLEFKGHRFRAPKNPKLFLRSFYGESWMIPDKNWDYATDPPNAIRRTEDLDITASRQSVSDFIFNETGARLI